MSLPIWPLKPSSGSMAACFDHLPLYANVVDYEKDANLRIPPKLLRWIVPPTFRRWLIIMCATIVALIGGNGFLNPAARDLVARLPRDPAFYVTHPPILLALALLVLLATLILYLAKQAPKIQAAEQCLEDGKMLATAYSDYLRHLYTVIGVVPISPHASAATQDRNDPAHNLETPHQIESLPLTHGFSDDQLPFGGDGALGEPESPESPAPTPAITDSGDSTATERGVLPEVETNDLEVLLEKTLSGMAGMMAVLGGQGTGKSTLLRHSAGERARQELRGQGPRCYPCYLDLADVKDLASRDFDTLLAKTIEQGVPGGTDRRVIEHIADELRRGPSLLLVDGLDKVSERERHNILERLDAMASHRPSSPDAGVRVVVAGRGNGSVRTTLASRALEIWEIQPLTSPNLQERFITYALAHPGGTSARDSSAPPFPSPPTPKNLRRDLSTGRYHMVEWLENPLLLTMVTVVRAQSGNKSELRSNVDLFRLVTERLLTLVIPYHLRSNTLDIAAYTALALVRMGRRSFTASQFQLEIQPYFPLELRTPIGLDEVSSTASLRLLGQSGLFTETATGEFDILHPVFRDYLAARALAREFDQWRKRLVEREVIQPFLERHSLLSDGPVVLPLLSGDAVVDLLAAKRGAARWAPVIAWMCGILTEREESAAIASIYRPDLVVAWIGALTHQRHDLRLFGLRLAAFCLAELADARDMPRDLVGQVAHRLVDELASTARRGDGGLTERGDRHLLMELIERCAALAQSQAGGHPTRAALRPWLARPTDWRVQRAVIRVIGYMGAIDGELRSTLLELFALLTASRPEIRREVATTIGAIARSATSDVSLEIRDAVSAQLTLADWRAHQTVAMSLGAIGVVDEMTPRQLETLLNSPLLEVQIAAMAAIGQLARRAAWLEDPARDLAPLMLLARRNLHHADETLRQYAIGILGVLGESGAMGEADLADLADLAREAVGDVDEKVRAAAIFTLGMCGRKQPAQRTEILNELLLKLGDESRSIREAASKTIADLAPLDASVHNVLCALAEDTSRTTLYRIAAVRTLGRMRQPSQDELFALQRLLEDDERDLRLEAIIALANMRSAAMKALHALEQVQANPSRGIYERVLATRAITSIRGPYAELRFHDGFDGENLLKGKDEITQAAAIRALGGLGRLGVDVLPDPRANLRADLRMIFADTNSVWQVRYAAALALGMLRGTSPEIVRSLSTTLGNPNAYIRYAAAAGIARMLTALPKAPQAAPDMVRYGTDLLDVTLPLLPPLVALLKFHRERPWVRMQSAACVRLIGMRWVEFGQQVKQRTGAPSRNERLELERLVREMSDSATQSAEDICSIEPDQEPQVRAWTMVAFAAMASASGLTHGLPSKWRHTLDNHLADPATVIRAYTAVGLTHLAAAGEDVLWLLRACQHSRDWRDWRVRQAAAWTIGFLAREASASIPPRTAPPKEMFTLLQALLQDPHQRVRFAALDATRNLGRLGAPLLADLQSFLTQETPKAPRRLAIQAIAACGEHAKAYTTRLRHLLTDPDELVRVAASHALFQLGERDEAVLKPLRAGLTDPDWHVRQAAARAIKEMMADDDPGVLALLADIEHKMLALLSDERREVRMAALEAVAARESSVRAAHTQLLDALATDTTGDEAQKAAEALAQLAVTLPPDLLAQLHRTATTGARERLYQPIGYLAELQVYAGLDYVPRRYLERMRELLQASSWQVHVRAVRAVRAQMAVPSSIAEQLYRMSGEAGGAAAGGAHVEVVRSAAGEALDEIVRQDRIFTPVEADV